MNVLEVLEVHEMVHEVVEVLEEEVVLEEEELNSMILFSLNLFEKEMVKLDLMALYQ